MPGGPYTVGRLLVLSIDAHHHASIEIKRKHGLYVTAGECIVMQNSQSAHAACSLCYMYK